MKAVDSGLFVKIISDAQLKQESCQASQGAGSNLLLLLLMGIKAARNTEAHMLRLDCSTAADMKIKVTVVWTCTFVIFLLVESCHAQKLNIHWGPQSMMYLKGKHGRRFVSGEDSSVVTQGLQGWYAVLRGIQKLQSRDFRKPSHIVSSEKVLIRYLQEI